MFPRRKTLLRALLLVVLALVLAGMVLPYGMVESVSKRFGWIPRTVDFLDTVAPGLEVSHLLAFATLGFLARFSWPRARPRKVCLAIVAIAALVEIVQIWVPGREAAFSHAVIEALGGMAGFGVAWLLTFAWGSGSLPPDYQPSTHWHPQNPDH